MIAERGVRHGRVVVVPTDVLIKPHVHGDGTRPMAMAHDHATRHRAPHRERRRRSSDSVELASDAARRSACGACRGPPSVGKRFSANDLTAVDVLREVMTGAGLGGTFAAQREQSGSCRNLAALLRRRCRPSQEAASSVSLRLLIAANVAAWAWALIAFHDYPVLLGTAFLAYSFGLRHAVDADHIAAIDNVTRKLMQEGKRPLAIGFFFSLGHSTVVVLAPIGVAATASAFKDELEEFHSDRRHHRHLGLGGLPAA